MHRYRVDFKLIRPTPNRNRVVFTWALADSEREAERKIRAYHGNVHIIKITKEA